MNRPEHKFTIPAQPVDHTGDLNHQVSEVWVAKHAPAIRCHASRGMSRVALIRIYGYAAVMRVLG